MRKHLQTTDKMVFNIFSYIIMTILSVATVFPFILIISGSLSSNTTILQKGFGLLPRDFSLSAYESAFKVPDQIFNAYKTSIIVTVCGTFCILFLCSMTGYVLSRKDYKFRNAISFYFFFTTIFSGGLVPWYILCVQYLGFKNYPLISLIVPGMFSYFYVIIIRTYIMGIPDSITESAKIDGANDFIIYIKLVLPMSKSILATVALFGALGYWNDWFTAMLFINNEQFYPLQYFLYMTLNTVIALNNLSTSANIPMVDLPTETFKLAMTVIATGPILLIYPFLQKYFIKGITMGAVKG